MKRTDFPLDEVRDARTTVEKIRDARTTVERVAISGMGSPGNAWRMNDYADLLIVAWTLPEDLATSDRLEPRQGEAIDEKSRIELCTGTDVVRSSNLLWLWERSRELVETLRNFSHVVNDEGRPGPAVDYLRLVSDLTWSTPLFVPVRTPWWVRGPIVGHVDLWIVEGRPLMMGRRRD
jgi:hypothetical protein